MLASRRDWQQNIILPEDTDYIEEEMAIRNLRCVGFARHNSLHHGLSSQTMIFNLLGPLVVRNDLELLKPIFEDQGISWPSDLCKASFEYENRAVFNEDYGQPTSIDWILRSDPGSFTAGQRDGSQLLGSGSTPKISPGFHLLFGSTFFQRRVFEKRSPKIVFFFPTHGRMTPVLFAILIHWN